MVSSETFAAITAFIALCRAITTGVDVHLPDKQRDDQRFSIASSISSIAHHNTLSNITSTASDTKRAKQRNLRNTAVGGGIMNKKTPVDINGYPIRFCRDCPSMDSTPSAFHSILPDGAGSVILTMLINIAVASTMKWNYVGECDFKFRNMTEIAAVRGEWKNSDTSEAEIMKILTARSKHQFELVRTVDFIFEYGQRYTADSTSPSDSPELTDTPLLHRTPCGPLLVRANPRYQHWSSKYPNHQRDDETIRLEILFVRDSTPSMRSTVDIVEVAERISAGTLVVAESATSAAAVAAAKKRLDGQLKKQQQQDEEKDESDFFSTVVIRGFYEQHNAEPFFDAGRYFDDFLRDTTILTETAPRLREKSKRMLMETGMNPLTRWGTAKERKVRVAMHIRRGDISPTERSIRYIPDDWYFEFMEIFKVIEPSAEFHAYTALEVNTTALDFIEYENRGVVMHFDDVSDIPSTWAEMITADVFLMTTSKFSYIPGIFNDNCVLRLSDQMYLRGMTHWVLVEEAVADLDILQVCVEAAKSQW